MVGHDFQVEFEVLYFWKIFGSLRARKLFSGVCIMSCSTIAEKFVICYLYCEKILFLILHNVEWTWISSACTVLMFLLEVVSLFFVIEYHFNSFISIDLQYSWDCYISHYQCCNVLMHLIHSYYPTWLQFQLLICFLKILMYHFYRNKFNICS